MVLLLPVVEQELPRLFGYSRDGSGIRQLWQVVTAFAGCRFHVKSRDTFDSWKILRITVTRGSNRLLGRECAALTTGRLADYNFARAAP